MMNNAETGFSLKRLGRRAAAVSLLASTVLGVRQAHAESPINVNPIPVITAKSLIDDPRKFDGQRVTAEVYVTGEEYRQAVNVKGGVTDNLYFNYKLFPGPITKNREEYLPGTYIEHQTFLGHQLNF